MMERVWMGRTRAERTGERLGVYGRVSGTHESSGNIYAFGRELTSLSEGGRAGRLAGCYRKALSNKGLFLALSRDQADWEGGGNG